MTLPWRNGRKDFRRKKFTLFRRPGTIHWFFYLLCPFCYSFVLRGFIKVYCKRIEVKEPLLLKHPYSPLGHSFQETEFLVRSSCPNVCVKFEKAGTSADA